MYWHAFPGLVVINILCWRGYLWFSLCFKREHSVITSFYVSGGLPTSVTRRYLCRCVNERSYWRWRLWDFSLLYTKCIIFLVAGYTFQALYKFAWDDWWDRQHMDKGYCGKVDDSLICWCSTALLLLFKDSLAWMEIGIRDCCAIRMELKCWRVIFTVLFYYYYHYYSTADSLFYPWMTRQLGIIPAV